MIGARGLSTLAGLALAVAAIPPAAQAGVNFDLGVTQEASRQVVEEDGVVAIAVRVLNRGPDESNPMLLRGSISSGAIRGVSGNGWTCAIAETSISCVYRGSLASGRTSVVTLSVLTSFAFHGPIRSQMSVSSPGELRLADNTSTLLAGVAAPAGHSASISPDGGEVTSDSGDGASAEDEAIATLVFPAGPGGRATLIEHVRRLDECEAVACVGPAVEVVVPPGYDDPANPIVVLLVYDATIAPVEGGDLVVLMIKPETGDDTAEPVPPCSIPRPVPGPCQQSQTRLENGDLEVALQMVSGDPMFQGSKSGMDLPIV